MSSLVSRSVLAALLAMTVLLIAACVPRDGGGRFYVVVEPTATQRFLDEVVAITDELGLSSSVVVASLGQLGRLHSIEATSWSVYLVVANVLLSGHEDPSVCGVHVEPHYDSAQFEIFANPTWRTSNPKAAKTVTSALMARLATLGYAASEDPAICGLAALAGNLPSR